MRVVDLIKMLSSVQDKTKRVTDYYLENICECSIESSSVVLKYKKENMGFTVAGLINELMKLGDQFYDCRVFDDYGVELSKVNTFCENRDYIEIV